MKPIAINSFTITKSLVYEGTLRVSRESYGKFVGKVLLVLAGLWVVLLGITLASGGDVSQTLVYLAIVAFVALWIGFIMPRSTAKRAYAKLVAQSDGDLHRTVSFYEDYLQITAENSVSAIDYCQVTQVLTSRRLLILTCQDKRGILILLKGFSLGDAQIVRLLIEEAKRKEENND